MLSYNQVSDQDLAACFSNDLSVFWIQNELMTFCNPTLFTHRIFPKQSPSVPINHKMWCFYLTKLIFKMDFSGWILFTCKLCFRISYAALIHCSHSLSFTLALICASCLVCCSWVQSGLLQASSASSGPSPPSLCSKYLWQPHTFLNGTVNSLSSWYRDQNKALQTSTVTVSLTNTHHQWSFSQDWSGKVSLYLLSSSLYRSCSV